MINALVTGHGEFSLGLLNALEMIAGEQEKVKAIPFFESDSMEDYTKNILKGLDDVDGENSEIIIFTDLMGGTPFNVSMLNSNDLNNVTVISGTNLPMLLEFIIQRWSEDNIDFVLDRLVHTANKGVVIGKIDTKEIEGNGDGI